MKPMHAALMICSALALAPAATLAQSTQGQKLSDRLVSRAEATIRSISGAEDQYKVTLAAYNTLLEGKAEDNQKAYKGLVKEVGRTEKALENVRSRVAAMDTSAQEYFTDWEQSIAAISSDDLKQRSQTRLDETKKQYAAILEVGQTAGDHFAPMLKSLHDQISYLGQELNPSSLASLADKAEKLNADSLVFYEKIEATLQTAGEYVDGLRAD